MKKDENAVVSTYRFGDYTLDDRLRRLYRRNDVVALTPKVFDTLLALVERAGRVVEKDEMLRVVWGDTVVGDETLAQNISTLRRLLGDQPTDRSSSQRYPGAVIGLSPSSRSRSPRRSVRLGPTRLRCRRRPQKRSYPSMGSDRSARGCRPNQRVGLDKRALGPTGSDGRIHRL